MCGSGLSVKGGMVSVIKNYIGYEYWNDTKITYIPTHIEKNKFLLITFFGFSFLRIVFAIMLRRIKIAHLHTAERGSFYRKAFLVQILKKMGIKTILHHHGAEFELFYANLSTQKKQYVNYILELTDLNIVLSERLIPMIRDKAPKAKVRVLYNAVTTYKLNPYNTNAKDILFLGRLGKRKGVYDLLEAIKCLDNKIPTDIRFYLCGDGEVEKVKSAVKTLGIEHRIAYIGWIDSSQKEKIGKQIMINVLPSYNEGLPMTILETMARGIPNISTNIASIPEVLHNEENGLLISPGDIKALTDSLHNLISDEVLRSKFSKSSYDLIAKRFSLDSNIKQLKDIYRTL